MVDDIDPTWLPMSDYRLNYPSGIPLFGPRTPRDRTRVVHWAVYIPLGQAE